jgi:SDR family mycofactocin-dependent oxidoreductase
MSRQFDGKVALITGAARGQGRSHALGFAESGADIIAIDPCGQIDSVAYPMARPEDLAETERLVVRTGRRIVSIVADVRDLRQLQDACRDGASELGRLDFVIANAGIAPVFGEPAHGLSAYRDAIDILLDGAHFTIEAAIPELLRHDGGGAIVLTSSAVAFRSASPSWDSRSAGAAGYTAAKAGVIGLMRYYATILGEKRIRVNSVHPSVVATPMAENHAVEAQVDEHPSWSAYFRNPLGVAVLHTSDVTAAVLYLCGESGRYITGVTLQSTRARLSVRPLTCDCRQSASSARCLSNGYRATHR